ncbi:MAG: ABC transporter ATP-binding protein [Lactobacillales bacterium]|nr:ABC transporter ATP-binding protein [Lactobacillales bacterium]
MKELCSNLKFTWKYAKDLKNILIKYILCNVVSIIISIVVPMISAKIIIALTDNSFEQLIYMAVLIFFIENLRNFIHYFARYYSQVMYRESFIKIQTDLGKNILRLENKIIDENNSGVFIQRLTNDTSRLADIFNVLNMYISNIIMNIGIFGAIFIIDKTVFIYLIIMLIILYIIEHIRTKKFTEEDKIFRKENEKVSGFVGEIVRGARDIKMLNSESSFINELHLKVKALNNKRYDMNTVDRKYSLLRGFTRDLTDLLLILLLVYLIKYNGLAVASALIIHNYSTRVPSIVDYIGMLLDRVKDYNLSASRIFAIIDSEEFKKEEFGTKHLDHVEGNFEFKNVVFSYDEEKVLNKANFKINANETVAFVGKSGAGKSTIFSLLCKMYDIEKGKITIDGIDIKELDRESIRGNITIISQSPYIFNLSIRDNLRLVKEDITEEEMIEACHVACLDEFIESLPDKYDTIVGEGGVNLSGGQKQRLAIARALVQKTEIILFDEATSALDNETQSKIQQAINNMKGEYTILIIAHRLSTVINSDRILFLDNGKIVDEGTHKELLKNNKEYKKLYEAEITK